MSDHSLLRVCGKSEMSDERSGELESQHSSETLIPQVYQELRRLAMHRIRQQAPGQTITGTALVHEAYLRLNSEGEGPRWASRSQFFGAAAEAMRRILIDRIRSKKRLKRGGDRQRVDSDTIQVEAPTDDEELVRIDAALDELAGVDGESAELVKLRFFVGMTLEEIADFRQVSVRTITRQWAYARAWLTKRLSDK